MFAHDWFNGFGSFVGMVEWNCADVVVENVSLDNAVEQSTANETEFAINCCSSTTNIIPALSRVVRKGGVGVLKVGDGDYKTLAYVIETE